MFFTSHEHPRLQKNFFGKAFSSEKHVFGFNEKVMCSRIFLMDFVSLVAVFLFFLNKTFFCVSKKPAVNLGGRAVVFFCFFVWGYGGRRAASDDFCCSGWLVAVRDGRLSFASGVLRCEANSLPCRSGRGAVSGCSRRGAIAKVTRKWHHVVAMGAHKVTRMSRTRQCGESCFATSLCVGCWASLVDPLSLI